MKRTNFEKARLLQIECEMNGMVAENKQRELRGESMAYVSDDFNELAARIEGLVISKE